ncbi:MerR family transcriptional regulator [Photobacterium lucens]|uniref:MerR family transcriptional regulator n=1 Tax=Photobacterium lucens TaxID=2562949 RepID=UPI001369EE4A|nr:MerR family transcriptional regulator [Photobacterium lucens]MBP2699638.1 MerR family transcriptional regulator [Vibrio parahaemolyticus]MZG58554.1 MerR family transcriptional regulator [Photobacterium lucens]MZG82696.1 MerR family transcriptional regulator [Photobacterium lucens]
MYRISELAQKVGLSRSTLLYYEKLKLITGTRLSNGYRGYTDKDVQRVKLLQQLQAGGLSLKECQACLDAQIDRELLLQRLNILDEEIAQKQKARDLLSAMLGMNSMKEWHQSMESAAPSAHLEWLMKQGFSEKQALRLKWLSKDMNEHEQYMADFETIFDDLERLGPSCDDDSLKALETLPITSGEVLDIGCGKGVVTTLLAKHGDFHITALDNDEYNLSCVNETAIENGLEHRITTVCASMTAMPFEAQRFDVLWAEGSAYIMGVEQALKQWQPLIKANGYLVISDLVWLTDSPSQEAVDFWQQNYPDMTTSKQRIKQMQQAGFEVISHFTQSDQSWTNYLAPLQNKLAQLDSQHFTSNAITDIKNEIHIHERYLGQYGYQLFVLKNKG